MWLVVTPKAKVSDSQIVIITNFVVVWSVDIKRVVCMRFVRIEFYTSPS